MQYTYEGGSAQKITEYLEGVLEGSKRLTPKDLGVFYKGVVEKLLQTPFSTDVDSARIVLSKIVPQRYWNLIWHTDALKSMWEVPNYLEDKNRTESEKKLQEYALRLIDHVLTGSQHVDTPNTTHETPGKEELTSHHFDNSILNRVGDIQTDGYEIMFDNSEHGQDAFAKVGDTYVVSDGVSSHPRSGIVSKYLSMGIARKSSEYTSFDEMLTQEPDIITKILETIADTEEYKNHASAEGKSSIDKGSATFTAVKIIGDVLEYIALGDSPLVVVDTNENGEVVGYELVTENNINNSNYSTQENLDILQDPETQAAGIKNGKTDIDLRAIKRGTIAYRKGRKIVLASDFLTKFMVTSKKISALKAQTGRNEMIRDAFGKLEREDIEKYGEMWLSDGSLNPLFLSSSNVDTKRLAEIINGRKKVHQVASDDCTAITLDLDKLIISR